MTQFSKKYLEKEMVMNVNKLGKRMLQEPALSYI